MSGILNTYRATIIVAALAVLGVVTASAQTPDDIPPALETICDMETGAAFGWCNAYCEAMDCEVDNTHASPTACGKVRSKFQQHTGRDMPCEVACPCNDPAISEDWGLLLDGTIPIGSCTQDSNFFGVDGVWLFEEDGLILGLAGILTETQTPFCAGRDMEAILPIDLDQAEVCEQQLEDAAAIWSVPCVPL